MTKPILKNLKMVFTKAEMINWIWILEMLFRLVKTDYSKLLDLSTTKFSWRAVFVFWTLQMSDIFSALVLN